MKEEDNNIYKFVILLSGASVGSVFALTFSLFILHLYRKHKLKENINEDVSNIEAILPINSYYSYNNRKIDTVVVKNEKYSLLNKKVDKNDSCKGTRLIDKTSGLKIYKLRSDKEQEYPCANNNTCCSNNMKTIKNSFDISSISSNDSINCVHRNNNKYSSIPCQQQLNHKFNPMCTSSPLPKRDYWYPKNDTFNVKNNTNEIDSPESSPQTSLKSSNSIDHQHSFDKTTSIVNEDSPLNSITRCGSSYVLKSKLKSFVHFGYSDLSQLSTQFDNEMLTPRRPDEWDLFDPKYVYDESFLKVDQALSSQSGLNLEPLCCQRNGNIKASLHSNFDVLCQAFGETGYLEYESLELQVAEDLAYKKYKVRAMFNDIHDLITLEVCLYIMWFTMTDHINECSINGVVTFQISDMYCYISQPVQIATSRVIDYVRQTSIQGNVTNHESFDFLPLLSKSSITDTDFAWKGRSRKIFKK